MTTNAPTAGERRTPRFNSEDDVIADIQRLRRGYKRMGSWTLPQICWHLDRAIQFRMAPPPHPQNTPEQDARKDVLREVLASGRLPSGIVAPEPMVPPPDCGDTAIDACVARLQEFKAFPGPIAPHRIFGKMPDADARRLNLIHCAHHLGHLSPDAPARRPHLVFEHTDQAIAEIERLRRDGYHQAGDWSLERICWHCRVPLQHAVDHPIDREPTVEEVEKQKWFTGVIAEGRKSGQRIEAPPTMQPPPNCPKDEPELLVAALRKLGTWDRPKLMMGPMGPMPLADAKAFHLFHLGHHLSFLVPITQA